ncbi:MAG: peptide/nickel transport system substrate-binding protein [Actinomycetota bacterium]|nr:peptide/nickel transport system substrate-binding protein [Actinomycetota bacterium]
MDRMRRRRHALTALVALAALALGACGGGGGSGNKTGGAAKTGATKVTGPSGAPKSGGTLRYGIEAETDGLNPTKNRFAISAFAMGTAVFDRLAHLDTHGKVKPYLALSWTPSADYMSWTVKLRPGVKFHDGTPFNAEAAKVGLDRAAADPLIGLAVRAAFNNKTPAEVVDNLTVKFNMKEPNTHLPYYLTSQVAFAASPKWLAAADKNPDLNQQPVGTGPFKFASRVRDGSTKFVRNDSWWGGKVPLDGIEFVVQTDSARRADQLLAGDLDVMHTSDPQTIKLLRGEKNIQKFEENKGEESFVMMNTQSAPFDDIRVRKALTLSTPKRKYLDVIGEGILTPADSMFHPDLKWYNPAVKQQADDPTAAAALAKQYCAEKPQYCTGDKIKMSFKYTGPSVQQDLTADTLVGGWESAFVVKRDQVLQDDYITQVALGNYQVVTWRQYGAEDPDGDVLWHDCRVTGPPGGLSLNWTRNCNPKTQAAFLEQRHSPDDKVQIAAWKTIAQNIHDDYIYVFLNHTDWMIAARDNVGDVIGRKLPDGSMSGFNNGFHLLSQIWLNR